MSTEIDDLKAELAEYEDHYKMAARDREYLGKQLQRAREALKKYGRHIGTGDCWVGLNSHGGTPECSCGYDDALRDTEVGK